MIKLIIVKFHVHYLIKKPHEEDSSNAAAL